MVWPFSSRRQVPYGHRQAPFVTPPQLAQAPLELLRSQNYPMAAQSMVAALQQGAAGHYPQVHWLPARMGQQHWKKQSTGYYSHPGAMAQAFVPVQAAMVDYFGAPSTTVQTARRAVQPHPTSMWYDRSVELQRTMDVSRSIDPQPRPIGRGIPTPPRWPEEQLDAMDDFEMYAAARWQKRRRDERMAAMARIRQLDREYGY